MLYLEAVAWSVFFSTAVAVEVYRIFLIASLFAYLAFAKKYGVEGNDGKFQFTVPWQAGLSNVAGVGEILGLFINGIVNDRVLSQKTIIGTLLLYVG